MSCNILDMPALKNRVSFRADVRVVASSTFQDDVFGLDLKTKRKRKVRVLDFSSSSSQSDPVYDVRRFESNHVGRRNRLKGSWKAGSSDTPKICVYILMTVNVGIFGIGGKAERLFADNYANSYLTMAQCAYCSMDEWMGKQVEEVLEIEDVDTSYSTGCPKLPTTPTRLRAKL